MLSSVISPEIVLELLKGVFCTTTKSKETRSTEDSNIEIIIPYFWHTISVGYSSKPKVGINNLNNRIFSVPCFLTFCSSVQKIDLNSLFKFIIAYILAWTVSICPCFLDSQKCYRLLFIGASLSEPHTGGSQFNRGTIVVFPKVYVSSTEGLVLQVICS